ncbi:MAG: hypothetical protein HQ477_10495 [Chloroflexi bacterium]|nr:hypothetical protein [Chloroflexota bacterium]
MNLNFSNLMNIQLRTASARLLLFAVISAMVLASLGQSVELPFASAQSQPDNILGRVTNGTEGGVLPDDLEVLLMSIDLTSNQIIEQEKTIVDKDGIFRFGNLVSGPGLGYRVVVNGTSYTPSIDMSQVENWQNVRISIYDETTALDDITLNSYVLMVPTIDARSRQVGVLTVINVNNTGDEVWIPDLTDPNLTGLDLLRFNLPEGFTDLSIESELPTGNILEIDTGFALTNPIPPGEFAILISYILSYEGDEFDFTLKLPYGAEQVRMLLPEGGGSISAEGFGAPESVVVADSVFNQFQGENYSAGSQLVTTFSGLPQPTVMQQVSDFFKGRTYVIVIIWIVGIALLAILGYAMYSSRKNLNMTSDDDDEMASSTDIIAEIAALDEEFEANNIDEDEYNERRDKLKRLALELGEHSTALNSDLVGEFDRQADSEGDDAEPSESSASENRKPEESDK